MKNVEKIIHDIINTNNKEEQLIKNLDYVICPVTGTHKSKISKLYIQNKLGMSLTEFENKFPNQLRNCIKIANKYFRYYKFIISNNYDPYHYTFKIYCFIERNTRRNKHLYDSGNILYAHTLNRDWL